MKSQQRRAYLALIRHRKQKEWISASVRFAVFAGMSNLILNFCNMTSCTVSYGTRSPMFRRNPLPPPSGLEFEAVDSSEMSANTYHTTRYTVFWASTMDFILPQPIFLSPRICALVAHVGGDDSQLPQPRLPCSIKSTYVPVVKNIPERLTLQTSRSPTRLKCPMSLHIKQQTSAWHWR
jgi:hypothetical protein